jgi:hypothetical protein
VADVIRDLHLSSYWSVNPGCVGVSVVSDPCPYFPGEPVYQQQLLDGQRASFDPTANERNDLQAGGITRGADRGFEIGIKFTAFPSNLSSAIWWLIPGPMEVHGSGLPQAVIQPECRVSAGVGAQGTGTPRQSSSLPAGEPRLFMDANSGSNTKRFYDMGPAVLNGWTYLRCHFRLSTGGDGYIRIYRDGDTSPRVSISGQTTAGSGDYYKLPNYSNAGLSGPRTFRWCGAREWNGLMPNRFTGDIPPPPPPPPASEPNPTLPAAPHPEEQRFGTVGTSQWLASQAGSKRGSTFVVPQRVLARGLVLPTKGGGSGFSGQQGHVLALYSVVDPNDPWQDVLVAGGVTPEVLTAFSADAAYKIGAFPSAFELPVGTYRGASFSGPNECAMWGITPGGGSLAWAYQTTGYPVPVSPFGSTAGGVRGVDTTARADIYLWAEPITTPAGIDARALCEDSELATARALIEVGTVVPDSEVRQRAVGPEVRYRQTEFFHAPTGRLVVWHPELGPSGQFLIPPTEEDG